MGMGTGTAPPAADMVMGDGSASRRHGTHRPRQGAFSVQSGRAFHGAQGLPCVGCGLHREWSPFHGLKITEKAPCRGRYMPCLQLAEPGSRIAMGIR